MLLLELLCCSLRRNGPSLDAFVRAALGLLASLRVKVEIGSLRRKREPPRQAKGPCSSTALLSAIPGRCRDHGGHFPTCPVAELSRRVREACVVHGAQREERGLRFYICAVPRSFWRLCREEILGGGEEMVCPAWEADSAVAAPALRGLPCGQCCPPASRRGLADREDAALAGVKRI